MQTIIRVLVAVVSLLALSLTATIWLHPENAATDLGIASLTSMGTATLRADLGGFFGALGLLGLGAAIRNEGRYAGAAIVLVGMALMGRVIDVLARGFSPVLLPSMVVEAAMIVLFVLAYRMLNRAPAA